MPQQQAKLGTRLKSPDQAHALSMDDAPPILFAMRCGILSALYSGFGHVPF